MGILQTAERSTNLDPSENVVFQRHLIAYKEAAKLVSGVVLEIGSGEGYGIKELAPKSDSFIAIDKYKSNIPTNLKKSYNIKFIKSEVPPLNGIASNSIDFIVSFQVIEHIEEDYKFIEEIHRVLKKGGSAIITTPNKLMSLSRNPWHIREYTPKEMEQIIASFFDNFELKGIFGNSRVMEYYNKNKASVEKLTKYDILNMQYWLPGWILRIPYDILNRVNRQFLQINNKEIVKSITYEDYSIKESASDCLDHFCILTK